MNSGNWHVSGEYFEDCNCDYVCPCVPSNFAAAPTQGHCDVGFMFHVNHGHAGDTSLDGLNFAILVHTPAAMGEGNWTVGLVIDERASDEQAQALAGIASGQAGGPIANLAPLITNVAGMERKPIEFRMDGLSRSASIPGMVEEAIEGVPSPVAAGEPMYLENSGHPVNPRIAMATSSRGSIHAFGIDWDSSGTTNGHFAPFDWSG